LGDNPFFKKGFPQKGGVGLFEIKLDGSASIHEQLYGEVSRLISMGILAPDEKLPAVRETAKALGVNPNTCRARRTGCRSREKGSCGNTRDCNGKGGSLGNNP